MVSGRSVGPTFRSGERIRVRCAKARNAASLDLRCTAARVFRRFSGCRISAGRRTIRRVSTVMRRLARILFSLPQYGGAPNAALGGARVSGPGDEPMSQSVRQGQVMRRCHLVVRGAYWRWRLGRRLRCGQEQRIRRLGGVNCQRQATRRRRRSRISKRDHATYSSHVGGRRRKGSGCESAAAPAEGAGVFTVPAYDWAYMEPKGAHLLLMD
jgi:hypothetical protein